MDFYLRGAKLKVGVPATGGREFNVRMAFNVEKLNGGFIGPGTQVTLYNLSDESRKYLEGRNGPKQMQLLAGYGGALKLIFTGDIFWISTERQGPDILTVMQSVSGLAAIQYSHLEENGITSDADLFNRILNALSQFGIGQGYISPTARQKFAAGVYRKPQVAHGSTEKNLVALLQKYGLQMSVDYNVLNVFDKNSRINPKVIVLSSETGLIGTPSRENLQMLKVKSLLNPLIEPGGLLEVHSTLTKLPARMTIGKVTHSGDTLEGPWESDVEIYDLGASATLAADSFRN